MATALDTTSGIATCQFEIKLPAPTASNLTDLIAYKSSILTEDVRGTAVYLHRFSTRSTAVVDDMLRTAMFTGTPRMRFRLGVGTPTEMVWMPWQDHVIRFYSGILESSGDAAGHHLELETADDLFKLSRVNKTTVRRGAVSDMVATIAKENKLESVIERTQGEYSFIQSYIDDTSMLFDRLRPRATNDKGRGNYVCYIKDGILHFHSPDYQAEVKELNYFSTPYVSLAQVDHSQRLWDEGISGISLVVYDPYTAEVRTFDTDPEKALRLSNSVYDFASVGGTNLNMFYNLSLNRPEEALSLAQNTYELARSKTFEIVATFTRLVSLRAGDIVRLTISPSDKAASPWSGYYLLAKTVTKVEDGAVHIVCSLQRGEIQQMQAQVTLQAPNQQLSPITQAPGHDLNLRAAQDSHLTRAVGSRTSTSVYATVVDASKLVTPED